MSSGTKALRPESEHPFSCEGFDAAAALLSDNRADTAALLSSHAP